MGEVSRFSSVQPALAARGSDDLWREFLDAHAPLVLQVVHLFERDADEIEDCFLYVCERLRRDDLRRIRKFRAEGAASFPTWLRAVVRRLCLDWRRHRDGRFRLPRAIARLPALEREVFRNLRLRGCSENETLHRLRALWPGLTRLEIADAAARVEKCLTSRQSWLLLLRRPRLQSLSGRPADDGAEECPDDPADPRADPERDAADHERSAALGKALAFLPARARLLLRLRFDQELPLEEVARLTGLSGASQVERQVKQALDDLRDAMTARGFPGVSVKEKQRP